MFVMVVTRNMADPDQVERKRINYSRDGARRWLAKHCLWAYANGYSITTYADDGKEAEMNAWRIWQDSPEYGCDDNPSYKWYVQRTNGNGHVDMPIVFDTWSEAYDHTVSAK